MLSSLKIKNFALIKDLKIHFDQGLSVITGETGAGKSILLGALKLVLGERADHSTLKEKDKKCIVEAEFNIKELKLEAFFDENELDYWEESILRREISPSGKSRSFINDSPVTLSLMKELGAFLIDIHAQHQTLQINNADFQLRVIDSLAKNKKELKLYTQSFLKFQSIKNSLQKLEAESQESKNQLEFWQFQWSELESLKYQEGEEEALRIEQESLANREEIISNQQGIEQLLESEEGSLLDQLNALLQLIQNNSKYLPQLKEIETRIHSCKIELDDIRRDLSMQFDDFDFDPQRMQSVDERLAEINRLQKKHFLENADELIQIHQELAEKIAAVQNVDDDILELQKELNSAEKELLENAKELTFSREKVLPTLKNEVEKTLQRLGISHARLAVNQSTLASPSSKGIDDFEILFSANQGVEPQRIADSASGGEISRLVLAVKALLGKENGLSTIIFDEIDTGVSGEVADQMGDVLGELAKLRQLISITHLPQIAAKGKQHYFVYKETIDNQTQTKLKILSQEERIVEIAKMLSGKKTTEAALNNAKELLN